MNCHGKRKFFLLGSFLWSVPKCLSQSHLVLSCPLVLKSSHSTAATSTHHERNCSAGSARQSDLDFLVAKVCAGNGSNEIFHSLVHDQACNDIPISHDLVATLLFRFKDDWKSALGMFRWAESSPSYDPSSNLYDMLVDILGKHRQMKMMKSLLQEMCENRLVTVNTIGNVMRRLSGAGEWEGAVRVFDDLGSFGLEKNTESMNLLLDTLCKENRVEWARSVFLKLKVHIPPDSHTFNIFIHGWCKANRVEEAEWTIQEMKGHGCLPCVISYSTIIQAYCQNFNFLKVYEILDEMKVQNCPPNIVTFTTILCYLTKAGEFGEALEIAEKVKSFKCKPDTLFYNAMIHTLGKAGLLQEALRVFEVEMPKNGIIPSTSTYNSMISMFCHHGEEKKALRVLGDLEISCYCRPDAQSFYPLIKLCFRKGKVHGVLEKLLDDMINKHRLSLDLSSYTLLIHGLCRSNRCEWGYMFFQEMVARDIKPRYLTCRLLLDEIRGKEIYDAADVIESFMKRMKSSAICV